MEQSRKKGTRKSIPVELEKAEEKRMPLATPDVEPQLVQSIKSRGQLEQEAAEESERQRRLEQHELARQSSQKFTRSLQLVVLGTLGFGIAFAACRYFYSGAKLINPQDALDLIPQ